MFPKYLCLICILFCAHRVFAQDSIPVHTATVSYKYYAQVTGKTNTVAKKINQQTTQAVNTLLTREKRMQSKLAQTDSLAAARIFTHSIDSLQHLQSFLKNRIPFASKGGVYNGYLDSLQNSLSFLKTSKELLGQGKGGTGQLDGSLQSVQQLQDKMQEADQVKAYIQSQKDLLNAQLSQYTGFTKELKGLNQQTYYYTQQLNEYKEMLHDKTKAETKAMDVLRQLPAYKAFMQKHSQLAALFNLQGSDAASAQSLEGLQTRSAVEQLIQQRLGGGAGASVGQQMDAARSQMNELKDKFPNLGSAGEMPNFKPNEMKTKSFLQRLEFGANTQFQKSSQYFPTIADIAGQVAYKFTKNGSLGVGASYKLGMGTGFNHIRFNSQGMGLRSFLEWKIKGTIYANGGFEENYSKPFSSVNELYGFRSWTGSALLGVSKKYKISDKLKGNIMLLYDFLWSSHAPVTQPVVLRMGYNF